MTPTRPTAGPTTGAMTTTGAATAYHAGGDESEAPTVVEKSLIPERYAKPGTGELVFTVSEGADNDFVLELVGR